jgi:RNA polymerase sigma-70 factor (ECF subfamily)
MGPARFVRASPSAVWTGEGPRTADDELVAAAVAGDREAFTVLYHRYKSDVWQLAWFTLHHREEAEDAVQETWVKAHRALGQYRRGGVRPWLLSICRNVCRDRMRSARRHPTLALDEDVADSRLGEPERDADFRRAVRALPADDREAFVLVDVLGCRSDEAARIAGLSAASTLRSRLARARQALVPAVAEPSVPIPRTDVWALRQTPRDSVVVVASGGEDPPPRGTLVPGGADDDLVDFLDEVDDRIPDSRRVLAVVNARPPSRAAVAAPWLAEHPRWNMRRALSHASWMSEVDELLDRSDACSVGDRTALRRSLADGVAITWTPEP